MLLRELLRSDPLPLRTSNACDLESMSSGCWSALRFPRRLTPKASDLAPSFPRWGLPMAGATSQLGAEGNHLLLFSVSSCTVAPDRGNSTKDHLPRTGTLGVALC